MATRFRITDSDGGSMTLLMDENWEDYDGRWLPEVTGKVAGSSDWNRNPYYAENVDGVPYTANLYSLDSFGGRRYVMRLTGISGAIFYENAGSGLLLWSAALTLKGGTISWQKL